MRFINWLTGLEPQALLLVIPLLLLGVILLIVLISRKPKLGIGILAAISVFGLFFMRRNRDLDRAFEVEDKIAEKNDEYAQFKNRQKDRYKAVSANQKVIEELKLKLEQLLKNPSHNKTEIHLLEKEIAEREEMNERILSDRDSPFSGGDDRDRGWPPSDDDLKAYDVDDSPPPVSDEPRENVEINVDGYQLYKA